MKRALLILILLIPLIGAAHAEDKFRVDATFYNNSSVEINSLQIVKDAERTTALNNGEFSIVGVNEDGERVIEGELPVEFLGYVRTQEGGMTYEKTSVNKIVYLNYSKNVTRLHVNTGGEDKASYNIVENKCRNNDSLCSSYCEGKGVDVDCTCGDGVCQESSNERELCSQDCRGDNSPDRKNDNEENQSTTDGVQESGDTADVVDSGHNTGILILIGILAILLSLILASSKVKIEA